MLKELHIASENFAGVPFALVEAERIAGIDSDIITLTPSKYEHCQEQTLNLPLFSGGIVERLRNWTGSSLSINNIRYKGSENPPEWNPSVMGKLLFNFRDKLWTIPLLKYNIPAKLENYSIITLDGGIGFLRSGKFVRKWAEKYNNLVTIYYGSELRKRGVIKQIDHMAKFVFSFEFDHTLIHPRAKFLFYPFFSDKMPARKVIDDEYIRIGHSPTRRSTKGTDIILHVLNSISKKYPNIKIILIENVPYRESLIMKSQLDIFIDQLGELGYGISSLEAMAMGIPAVCEILDDFDKFLGEHPFVVADKDTLENKLSALIENESMRIEYGQMGKNWVRKVHNPLNAITPLLEAYREAGWI